MKLAGGTVLITGASQGLGAATARAIAARGAEVVLLTCGEDKPRNVAAKIDAHGVVEEWLRDGREQERQVARDIGALRRSREGAAIAPAWMRASWRPVPHARLGR